MTDPVRVLPLQTASVVSVGAPIGEFAIGISAIGPFSQVVAYGPMVGGALTNPSNQGSIVPPEQLYYSIVGPASIGAGGATFALEPGETFEFPEDNDSSVWVAAATAGHPICGYVLQAPLPPPESTVPGSFPPSGPTTLTRTMDYSGVVPLSAV